MPLTIWKRDDNPLQVMVNYLDSNGQNQSFIRETSTDYLQKIKNSSKAWSNTQAYTAIYSLLGIVQGMGFSYLSAVLSTIEKQFGIRSKVWEEYAKFWWSRVLFQETAWVFSGNEISQICFIFALPFLSKIHRRTLWTSVAMICAALGLFLCASPFFAKVTKHPCATGLKMC